MTPERGAPAGAAPGEKGAVAAAGVVGLGAAYAVALGVGLSALPDPDAPIGDPWFTLMELLIVGIAPFMVALIAAIHGRAPPAGKPAARLALAFMTAMTAVTCSLHVVILTVRRMPGLAADPTAERWLAFRWPSPAYALDVLAWDLFFGLAALFAGAALKGAAGAGAARRLLQLSGALALAGLAGPLTGAMALRNLGVLGYAVVFPVAAAALLRLFLRPRDADA